MKASRLVMALFGSSLDFPAKVAENNDMAQFQPGQAKPLGSGRKRGTRNKKSQHLADILEAVGLNVPERLIELLPQLSAEKQAGVLIDLMSFLYPKRKAVETTTEISPEQNCIRVEFMSPDDSEKD